MLLSLLLLIPIMGIFIISTSMPYELSDLNIKRFKTGNLIYSFLFSFFCLPPKNQYFIKNIVKSDLSFLPELNVDYTYLLDNIKVLHSISSEILVEVLPDTSKQIIEAPVQTTGEIPINIELKQESNENMKYLAHNILYNIHISKMKNIANDFYLRMLNLKHIYFRIISVKNITYSSKLKGANRILLKKLHVKPLEGGAYRKLYIFFLKAKIFIVILLIPILLMILTFFNIVKNINFKLIIFNLVNKIKLFVSCPVVIPKLSYIINYLYLGLLNNAMVILEYLEKLAAKFLYLILDLLLYLINRIIIILGSLGVSIALILINILIKLINRILDLFKLYFTSHARLTELYTERDAVIEHMNMLRENTALLKTIYTATQINGMRVAAVFGRVTLGERSTLILQVPLDIHVDYLDVERRGKRLWVIYREIYFYESDTNRQFFAFVNRLRFIEKKIKEMKPSYIGQLEDLHAKHMQILRDMVLNMEHSHDNRRYIWLRVYRNGTTRWTRFFN